MICGVCQEEVLDAAKLRGRSTRVRPPANKMKPTGSSCWKINKWLKRLKVLLALRVFVDFLWFHHKVPRSGIERRGNYECHG
jgi:hypothetical protein